ncbi:FAD-dependent thymidylate synthase [Bacteroidetes/Chlorobi group bacterium Naka2016]|nr:MAG: FAD-dependent thymidylate synthase [Bacteroidetes/Chlorobi group bacterium Naka2016]
MGKEFKCLDKGFVRLVDIMGGDESIVQAARVSYGRGTKTVSEDRNLIRYLMRHRHTSPFEMVEYKFHIKLPIFVARQWIRHRTANVNEYSGRYSVMPDEFYVPSPEDVRTQSKTNKQGRSDEPIPEEIANEFIQDLQETQNLLYEKYNNYLSKEIARELARINLPLSTYTEWYWKIDLHNLFHFLELRLHPTAQYEIREYAKIIAQIVKETCPIAYQAFEDYRLNSVTFSAVELKILKNMIQYKLPTFEEMLEMGLTKREVEEFFTKISFINNFK